MADDITMNRLRQAKAMQAIEGNPLTAQEIGTFEMFERKGWSHTKRRQHLLMQLRKTVSIAAE